LSYTGTAPSPRAFHGAIVDQQGRIVIFGGYNGEIFLNDVYYADIVNLEWETPFISGTAPVARESFSMSRVREYVLNK
jgi:N-acetylneuraminic acid mutarotase